MSLYYMHDNFTFSSLFGTEEEILDQIIHLVEVSPYGSLGHKPSNDMLHFGERIPRKKKSELKKFIKDHVNIS